MELDLAAIEAAIDRADRFTLMAKRELARCEEEARFLGWIIPEYRVEWTTMGHTAGWCIWPHGDRRHYRICFNAYLAAQEGERFRETVAHELAHTLAAVNFADRGHGRNWRNIMQILGYAGARCHSYRTLSAKQRRRVGI